MAAQILQAKTADRSIREHCSSRRFSSLHGIPRLRHCNLSRLLCCVRNRGVFSCRRRTLRSRPSPFGASMLRGSLDCMLGCLLVGCELLARFPVQHGGARRDRLPLLCGSLCSTQDTKHTLRFLDVEKFVLKRSFKALQWSIKDCRNRYGGALREDLSRRRPCRPLFM